MRRENQHTVSKSRKYCKNSKLTIATIILLYTTASTVRDHLERYHCLKHAKSTEMIDVFLSFKASKCSIPCTSTSLIVERMTTCYS